MMNYTLVIVSGRTVVVREFDRTVTLKELRGCTHDMRQTLILSGNSVIFEHINETTRTYASAESIKSALKEGKEIRVLTEREIKAVERVRFRIS